MKLGRKHHIRKYGIHGISQERHILAKYPLTI